MVSVKVISKATGNSVKQCRVGLSVGVIGGVYHEYTDHDGEAHFHNANPADAEIYIDGKVAFKGFVSGMKVVYV
ncbi:MAG: hypothetical protein JWN14_2282 [Chthonomonadales bacterium]|nr:hypothetical protein [Chthonomonadales bacterium]